MGKISNIFKKQRESRININLYLWRIKSNLMNNLRFEALRKIAYQERSAYEPNENRFDHFAENVLDEMKLQNYLSKTAFKEMTRLVIKGLRSIAL